jgi:RNA polymerase sigma factor (TIGR02999 family)
VAEAAAGRVTAVLRAARSGDPGAVDELLPLVYDELRRLAHQQMAREAPGQTLQPTALVHEVYLKLVNQPEARWNDRAHVFAVAARAMRQILVNRAHKRRAAKHGGGRAKLSLDDVGPVAGEPPADELLALDEALDRLAEVAPDRAQIVMLRYFAGLTVEETARALGLSPRTVKRHWRFAKAWLRTEMTEEP